MKQQGICPVCGRDWVGTPLHNHTSAQLEAWTIKAFGAAAVAKARAEVRSIKASTTTAISSEHTTSAYSPRSYR